MTPPSLVFRRSTSTRDPTVADGPTGKCSIRPEADTFIKVAGSTEPVPT